MFSELLYTCVLVALLVEGHFTHEPRAVTMKLREPKRKCNNVPPKSCSVVKCNVKPYVTGPSNICYFNEFLFI